MLEKIKSLSIEIFLPYMHALISASLIAIIGLILALIIKKYIRKILMNKFNDLLLANFISRSVYYVLLAAVCIAVLGVLGVPTTSIITILGTAGLAIAFALRDSLSSVASGIILIIFRPFKFNDKVEIDGKVGRIQDITLLYTILRTSSDEIIIPNRVITNTKINVTKEYKVKVTIKQDNFTAFIDELKIIKPEIRHSISALSEDNMDIVLICFSLQEAQILQIANDVIKKLKLQKIEASEIAPDGSEMGANASEKESENDSKENNKS